MCSPHLNPSIDAQAQLEVRPTSSWQHMAAEIKRVATRFVIVIMPRLNDNIYGRADYWYICLHLPRALDQTSVCTRQNARWRRNIKPTALQQASSSQTEQYEGSVSLLLVNGPSPAHHRPAPEQGANKLQTYRLASWSSSLSALSVTSSKVIQQLCHSSRHAAPTQASCDSFTPAGRPLQAAVRASAVLWSHHQQRLC